MIETKKKVDRIERALERFISNVGSEFNKLYNLQTQTERKLGSFVDEMKDFKDEMKNFKDEMVVFKNGVVQFQDEMKGFKDEMVVFKDGVVQFQDEMKDFKDEMVVFKDGVVQFQDEMKGFKDEMVVFKDGVVQFQDEMKGFKDEMVVFKNGVVQFQDEMKDFKDGVVEFNKDITVFKGEMKDFKTEAEADRNRMNKQWGELARKMGTVVEDITAPSLPRLVKDLYGKTPELMMQNVEKKLKDGTTKEFDIIGILDDCLFVNSTKSTLRSEDISIFIDDIQQLRIFFPEYKEKRIIGFLASLSVKENILKQAEKKGFYVMALGNHLMDLINSEGFKPKEW